MTKNMKILKKYQKTPKTNQNPKNLTQNPKNHKKMCTSKSALVNEPSAGKRTSNSTNSAPFMNGLECSGMPSPSSTRISRGDTIDPKVLILSTRPSRCVTKNSTPHSASVSVTHFLQNRFIPLRVNVSCAFSRITKITSPGRMPGFLLFLAFLSVLRI